MRGAADRTRRSIGRFFSYGLSPLRGGDDDIYLRPGGIVGLIGALLVVAAGVIAMFFEEASQSGVAASYPAQQPAQPPRGWYPDPSGSAAERYWDGTTWGNETR